MSAVRGISQYQQAGIVSAGETQRQTVASESVQAKMVTKTVGFRLGKFGVSYASEDLEVDAGSLSSSSAVGLSGKSFAAELDVATLRSSLTGLSSYESSSSSPLDRTPTALTRRLGSQAYSQAVAAGRSRVDVPSVFQVAV